MARQRYYVFIHDLGASPLQWEDQVVALPPGMGAACPWLRGTRPGGAPADFTIEGAAGDILMALDLDGVQRATLVGFGLGATVALSAAADDPERIERVVALSAHPVPSRTALAAQRAALRLVPARTLANQSIDKARLMAALKTVAQPDLGDRLRTVQAPVLVVAGANDRALLANGQQLVAALPNATLEVIPGVGRDLLSAARDEVNALLYDAAAYPPAQPDGTDEPLRPWDLR